MRLPESLQTSIDQIVQASSPNALKKAREALSQEYRQGDFSQSIFSDEGKKLAYLAARFPATYAAIQKVMAEVRERIPGFTCRKILDLGAGPGTATWAALDLMPELEEAALIEKSPGAVGLGKELMRGFPNLKKGEWICRDLESEETFPSADLAIASYSIGELKHPESVIVRLWKADISYLIIIEPGTPRGYRHILSARDQLLRAGAHLIAPCPHSKACPLKDGDWCHFSARLERTKLHRLLKEGSLGYEDEKYSYLIVSRKPVLAPPGSRILRHPQKGSGHVRLALCTDTGQREERVVSRKEKEIYRAARDAEWGGVWYS